MKTARGWASVPWRKAAWVLGYVPVIYVATYLLLMEPRIGAVIDLTTDEVSTFYSGYLFAPTELVVPRTLTIYIPTTTWANTVFYPIDAIRSAMPSIPLLTNRKVSNPLFWLTFFAPIWFPGFALPAHESTGFRRRMTCLVAIGWFFLLILMRDKYVEVYNVLRHRFVVEGIVIAGTLTAIAALAFSAKGWRHLVNVPLGLAILSGSYSVCWFFDKMRW
jgi:hypothetical protein